MDIFKTRLKVLLRTKENLFWAFFFPLLLGTFFYVSFGTLSFDNPAETIDLYIESSSLESSTVEGSYFISELVNLLEDIEYEKGEQLFIVNKEFSSSELDERLEAKEIVAYIIIDGDANSLSLKVNENGMNQTIIKSVLDGYIHSFNIYKNYPEKADEILNDLTVDLELLVDEQISSNASANSFVIYFYALIAMICIYSGLWGLNLVKDIQADQSSLAFRVSVAPTSKLKLVSIYFLAAFLIAFVGNMILLCYLKFILGVDLGNFLLVSLVVLIGTITGMAFGGFITSFVKGSITLKENLVSAIGLLFSAMAGLMNQYVKFLITSNVPILGYINPANLITEALYSLYYYSGLELYFQSITILGILGLLMIGGIVWKLRKVKYDSI